MKSQMRWIFSGTIAAAVALAATLAANPGKLPPPAAKNGLTYAKDIQPIFEKSCFKCHGPEKQKWKMRLDNLESALKGGEKGKVIKPGDSANSPLVHSVARIRENEDENMPPEGKAPELTAEQVGLIRAWIDQGAK